MASRRFAACVLALVGCGSSSSPSQPLPDPSTFVLAIKDAPACALNCDPGCNEAAHPWKCPALADWSTIPHDPIACGSFDGKTYPTPVQGKCVATDPAGDAIAKAQTVTAPYVLPDGRRLAPAGKELVFESDGGFPSSQLLLSGTRFLAVSDYGYNVQSLRIIDTFLLKVGDRAEVARATFNPPAALNYGLAYVPSTKILYASSGSDASSILAYDLDTSTGAITADPAKKVKLPGGVMPSGLDVSADGKTLLVGDSLGTAIFIVSLDAATYGTQVGTIDVGAKDLYALHFDPNDPTGNTAYATLWTTAIDFNDPSKMKLLQLDVGNKSAVVISVGKSPEEILFLDSRYALVANALGDSLSVVDRPSGQVVSEVPVANEPGPTPTAMAYDASRGRLYVTLAADNSLEAFDVTPGTPPTIAPAGSIPTAWWPTAVSVDPSDGTIYALTGRGHGIGADATQYAVSAADEADKMAGSIQAIDPPDDPTLASDTQTVAAQNDVADMNGYSTVQCNGAPYDFPIPLKPEDGPSTKIQHVFLIVRENKTFDGVMGDRPGIDGDPTLVLAPGNMDAIWPNAFAIAKAFTQMDNYYIDAEQSIQGHTWTVFGRSTDYAERRWLTIWGRSEFSITLQPGVGDGTTPSEGNIFEFLSGAGISVDNQGELVGGFALTRDTHWPGGSTDSTDPDTLGGCYVAGRLRATCDPKDFTYSWLTNDHTFGFAAGKPNPALMIATND
ncbi:MAG: YncE family protein, partial [Polyangiaceae bacterium]